MSKLGPVICAGAVALLLGACADEHGYYHGGFGYAYGAPMDVWYDGFYGPYPGGYWDGDAFVYLDRSGAFGRDRGGHFRHERFHGAQGFRTIRPPEGRH